MSSITLSDGKPVPKRLLTTSWHNFGLRQCLLALGFTDQEMRYERGVRFILDQWINEVPDLIVLIKKKWKAQVIHYHEANGGDHEQWTRWNSIYSAALKKVSRALHKDRNTIQLNCEICNRMFHKKITNSKRKTRVCSSSECRRLYKQKRSRERKQSKQIQFDRICANPGCGKRILTHRRDHFFHSTVCWRKVYNAIYHLQNKHKRISWKALWTRLTPEEKEAALKQARERARARIEAESLEQRTVRLAKHNARMKAYRKKRAAEGRPLPNGNVPIEVWLAKKKEKLKDKPWIYETILQKYSFPDGSVSWAAPREVTTDRKRIKRPRKQ